jgi:NitT/TauT family transport system permease protein
MKRPPVATLWLLPLLTGALFVGCWYGAKALFGVADWLLPTPAQIFQAAWMEKTRLWSGMLSSAVGALGGFGLAGTLGFALALPLAWSKRLHASLYPWLLILQMTPVIVLTPIIVHWAGPGLPGIITITFLISFFPVLANTTQGLLSADRNHVALFRMCNATRGQELLLLRVPSALPQYLTGLRIAAALAPVGSIFGEFMVGNQSGGSGGLGFLVYSFNAQIKIPALFATALASCMLGFVFVAAVTWLNRAVLHKWHDSFERTDR